VTLDKDLTPSTEQVTPFFKAKFEHRVLNNVVKPHKKTWAKKNKKQKKLCRVLGRGTQQRGLFAEC